MAEGLLIQVGADVQGAIRDIGKLGDKLGDLGDEIPSLIKGSANLEDALDKLAKQGLVSISSLEDSIKDFKKAFAESTDPAETKKFGDAIKVLEERQKQLIDSGLRVVDAENKVSASHASHTVGANKLSNSLFGLSKIFNLLPAELSHLTHGFDQVIQSYESVTKGTESTTEKVGKFASALGSVGLGLAISVAAGLLVGFVSELLNTDAALEKATEEGIRFSEAIASIDENIKSSKENIKFIGELSDLNVDINFGKGFEGDLLKVRGGLEDLRQDAFNLGENFKKAGREADEAFKLMGEGISDAGRAATGAFVGRISQIPDAAIKGLKDADKQLIANAKSTAAEREKIQEEIFKNEQAQELQRSRIRLTKTEEERKQEKERNDALRGLLESRANIIKEFTAKFATIKDPFPDFFSKNLPLGKVEDKALRAALENAFKVLEQASRELFDTKRIDPGTIPLEIKFKPEIVGKSALVREIEDKFGEISKAVEDAVNKGIFEVPLDFKLAPEGDGQALKQAEDLVNDLAKSIESFSGQRKAILNFDFDVNKLDPAVFEKVMDDAQDLATRFASGTPLIFSVDAELKVHAKIDKDRLKQDFQQSVSDAVNDFVNNTLSTIGESVGQGIGDALSGNGIQDAFKGLLKGIGDSLAQLGKALIKAGIIGSGLTKAISALGKGNPALAIAAGIALIALSRALQNSLANGGREKGGPVQKGFAYTVNERGREMFVPNSGGQPRMIDGGIQTFYPEVSGKIIPASLAKAMATKFNIPRFEFGGLVSGSTFGLLGEGAGISASNPEVIAPLDRLKGLLGLGVNQELRLKLEMQTRGKDYALINNRQNRFNQRNT